MIAVVTPWIAFVLGDPTGIGPEICAKILHDQRMADVARLVVIGDARILKQGARDASVTLDVERTTADRLDQIGPGKLPLIDLGNMNGGLSTVLTTPSHGTAYDIVGRGVATTGALQSAIRLAAQLSARQIRQAA